MTMIFPVKQKPRSSNESQNNVERKLTDEFGQREQEEEEEDIEEKIDLSYVGRYIYAVLKDL